jgi:hypothetical protein
VPPHATVRADVATRDAVGIRERWQVGGHGAEGGCIAGGGGAPVERFMRPHMVEPVAAVGELLRLGAQVGAGWAGGVGVRVSLDETVTYVSGPYGGSTACEATTAQKP